jgi:hypothetical protein
MKRFFIVTGIVVISLVCIIAFKDLIIKSVVTRVASDITGAPVHMDDFSINIFSSTIHITGFKMYNPSGFPEDILVSCPKIDVIFDRASLFKQKPHVLLMNIELKDMVLTKNKAGKLNVDSLKIVKQSKSSPPNHVQIDLLNLSIGKIVYKDYTVGTQPSVRVVNVNKHKSYKSIPTIEQLALLVLAEPMKAALIKNAAIYGTVMLTGVAVLPVVVAATFIGKDSVQQSINAPMEQAYKISLEVIKRMGRITKDDAPGGVIKADINGSMVALMLKKSKDNKTEITVSARKYMLPEADIAGGVLYQILDKLS